MLEWEVEMRARSWRVTAALVAAVLLTGCGAMPPTLVARVPTSGAIEQGEQVTSETTGQFVRVIARGPRPGMSPGEIVRGFLDASASFEGDHAVARQFLTEQADAVWRPNVRVDVYEGVGTLASSGEAVQFTATKVGAVSNIGRYEVAPTGTELMAQYQLQEVDGEWRIGRLPDGLTLSVADLDRSYRALAVYFFNPDFSMLVPDPRLLPLTGATLASTLVRYLMSGPSEWLAPAVRSAFPPDVTLAVDSVTIESGVASVQLNATALLLGDEARTTLSEQLVWTLRQVPEIQSVAITAGGQRFTVPGVAYPQPRGAWPGMDPDALPLGSTGYFLRGGVVQRVTAEGQTSLAFSGGDEPTTKLTDFAVSLDSRQIAGLDAEGRLRWGQLDRAATLVAVGARDRLRAPAFDADAHVWVLDRKWQPVAFGADGVEVPIRVSDLPATASLRHIVPSRDGTRAALVVQEGSTGRLLVGRIVRTGQGEEIRVERPLRVESTLANVIDVAWSGSDALEVIGSIGTASLGVFSVDLARGLTATVGGPASPSMVGAAPTKPTLLAQDDGLVYRLQAGTWISISRGTHPTYPG